MPLLHRDPSRGGGGSQENRRSLAAEILSFDASQFTAEAAAPTNRANDDIWRWEPPGSPEAAPSPRSLVPPGCFPPRHPGGFGSYSESARPGSWAADSEGMADLIASFTSMPVPSQPTRRNRSFRAGLSCEELERELESQSSDSRTPPEQRALVARRASFSGLEAPRRRLVTWSGTLPPRCMDADPPGGFSAKVFMGGLPWDITEEALLEALRPFHPVRVEWPGRECAPRGFAYVTLDSERRVRALLGAARRAGRKWLLRVAARGGPAKDAEVIPWAVADGSWVARAERVRLAQGRTVFVGALHGVLSARALAGIMQDLFSGVVYAGIDTDKSKYPIGSGRVTFDNVHSYVSAISAGYVEVRTDKFVKKLQVDPYLEDSMCSFCKLQQGPYFCREPVCFRYFCRACWAWNHRNDNHKPLMRNSKNGNVQLNGIGGNMLLDGVGSSNMLLDGIGGGNMLHDGGGGGNVLLDASSSSSSGASGSRASRLPPGEHVLTNGGYAHISDATPSPPPSAGEAEAPDVWGGV